MSDENEQNQTDKIQTDENNEQKLNNIEAQTGITYFIALLIIIIIGNYIFDAKVIFHSNGHFGILLHPWKCLKELYFSWGFTGDKFLFTLTGLKTFFLYIQAMYSKYGVISATWCLLTQFSPLWGILIFPLCRVIYYFDVKGNDIPKKALAVIFIICSIIKHIDNGKYANLTPREKSYLQNERMIQKGNKNARDKAIKFVDSYITVKDMLKEISKEIEKLNNREQLGIEDNTSKVNLLKYKSERLGYLLDYNGVLPLFSETMHGNIQLTLDAPCNDYCYSCAFNNMEDMEQCINKYMLNSIESLISKYTNANAAYQMGEITKDEFEKIKNDIKSVNKKIIEEANKINNLKTISSEKSCQNVCEANDNLIKYKKEWQEILDKENKNCEEEIKRAKNYIERFPENEKSWDAPRNLAINDLKEKETRCRENINDINNRYSKLIQKQEQIIDSNKDIYDIIKNSKNQTEAEEEPLFIKNKVYEKLGVSKNCLKDWQILQDEGEFKEEPICNEDEIKKVDEYCKKHDECYVFYD